MKLNILANIPSTTIYSQQDIELAWAAGFFDGEGCTARHRSIKISHRGNKTKYLHNEFYMHIGQTSKNNSPPEVLIRFKNAVEIGSVNGPYYPKNLNHSIVYHYQATNKKARQVLELLWPYLGEVKRQQAIKAGYKSPEMIYELMREGKI